MCATQTDKGITASTPASTGAWISYANFAVLPDRFKVVALELAQRGEIEIEGFPYGRAGV